MMPLYRKSYLNNLTDTIKVIKNSNLIINLFDVSLRDGLQSKKKFTHLIIKKKYYMI